MKRRGQERSTLDLMEEAVELLRSTPLNIFGWYLLGTLPFLIGLLYFWTDMSLSALAYQHRAEASLGVALLFIWMKCGQAVFARKLRAGLARIADDRLTASRLVSIALQQAIVQPSKLFVLPLAALATIPFGWVWAFYENATVLGSGETPRKLIAKAWEQARCWPRQNHCALSIYLLLLGVVFLNVAIVVVLLPQLLKSLLGIETIFTRSAGSMFNTTFFAVICVLTYLICDPFLKAIYTLRCFHGESLRSGEDLAAELHVLRRLGPAITIVLLAALLAISPVSAAPSQTRAPLPAAELNQSIEETVKRPEFSWKLPRQAEKADAQRKWPFVDAIGRFLKATGRVIKRAFKAIGDWMNRQFASRNPEPDSGGTRGWQTSSRFWMTALLSFLALAVVVLLVQALRRWRRQKSGASPLPAATPIVDLTDENVTADLLPEDEWLALARSHLALGELRLALRAFFLAGLAHLAGRQILILARHKSNRDYQTELRRKARDRPSLLEAFGQNIAIVERVWYGRHEIDADGVARFENNLEEIRTC
jgi:hypothetical protein